MDIRIRSSVGLWIFLRRVAHEDPFPLWQPLHHRLHALFLVFLGADSEGHEEALELHPGHCTQDDLAAGVVLGREGAQDRVQVVWRG